MKKKIPAKKGFAPFKESKSSSTSKNTQRSFRSADDSRSRPGGEFTDKGQRRKMDDSNPERKRFSGEFSDNDKGDRRRMDDSKPARKRLSGEFSDNDKGDRRRTDDSKPARKRLSGEFSDNDKGHRKRNDDSRPSYKTDAYGKKLSTGRASRQQPDDSAFHGASSRGKASGRAERPTPSGFNRKKFFDTANERFADKQARKTARNTDAAGKHNSKSEAAEGIPGEMPLNKYIAHSGLCSRRKAVDYVKEGKVSVNGTVIKEPAFKVTPKDEVKINDKRIHIQKNLVYILLNKPKGYITTTDDPEGRRTVMELIKDATTDERVYPVGRLDRNTSGLLLLTNDGELAQKLAHPKHNIRKIYHVGLDKPLTKTDFDKILQGVTLEDGIAHVDALGYVDTDKSQVGIEIHSGKNRIVRRIFEHLEYQVEKLDRVTYAGLTKKNVNRGKWRFLSEKEVILLKHFK